LLVPQISVCRRRNTRRGEYRFSGELSIALRDSVGDAGSLRDVDTIRDASGEVRPHRISVERPAMSAIRPG
jgi:hypothetical protein